MIHQLKDQYAIQKLCFVLTCSRSGYYDWIALGKPAYKAFDESLNKLIIERYLEDKRQGITRIKMNLKKIHGLILTKATVYRYMRLNGIQSIIRKKRHQWGTKPHHQIPNLLKRDFTTKKPNEKWSIDVSYLFTKQRILSFIEIKDVNSRHQCMRTYLRYIMCVIVYLIEGAVWIMHLLNPGLVHLRLKASIYMINYLKMR